MSKVKVDLTKSELVFLRKISQGLLPLDSVIRAILKASKGLSNKDKRYKRSLMVTIKGCMRTKQNKKKGKGRCV